MTSDASSLTSSPIPHNEPSRIHGPLAVKPSLDHHPFLFLLFTLTEIFLYAEDTGFLKVF